jgi:hypothetical protein
MQITVVRSGGQMGRPFKLGPIDTGQLGDEQRQEIEKKVEDAGFFDLPARIDDVQAFDTYTYEITIHGDERTNTVAFDETSQEAEEHGLQELVKLLEQAGGDWQPEALGGGGGGDDAAPRSPDGHELDCDDKEWQAWYDRMPPNPSDDLHVTGRCKAPVAGVRARLVLGNEGVADEPDLLVLELKVEWPEVSNQVEETIEVNQVFHATPGIERVRIQGGAEAEIEVREAS